MLWQVGEEPEPLQEECRQVLLQWLLHTPCCRAAGCPALLKLVSVGLTAYSSSIVMPGTLAGQRSIDPLICWSTCGMC